MTLRRAGCIGTEMQGMRSKNRCKIHMYVCVCVCVCVYARARARACVYTYMYIYMYIYILCVRACTCIYIEQVQVVAIDRTLEPPSFGIRVDGQIRETEAILSQNSFTQ
jgi:hypothetical protein